MAKALVVLGAALAVLTPLAIHIKNVSWADSSPTALMFNLFPMFGLLAFGLLWLHAMSGAFEEWLRERFDFDAFVHWTAYVILVSILLHPLLLLIIAKFDVLAIFAPGEHQLDLFLGLFGLILLLTYDVGKALKKREFFAKNWNWILIVSNVGFVLTFFHSLNLWSDLQTGWMRKLWLFYGITAIAALIYTYGVKRRKLLF